MKYKTKYRASTRALEKALTRLREAQKRPVCPRCKEQLIRTHYQLPDGSWIVFWLCECEPDPKVYRLPKSCRL